MDEAKKNETYEAYAAHSKDNELEIVASKQCGCYFCRHIFSARQVSDWVEDGKHVSALCPECGMDTVMGDASGIPLSKEMLKDMNQYFYGDGTNIDEDSAKRFCLRYLNGNITHKEKNEILFRTYLTYLASLGDENATMELAILEETGGDFGTSDLAKAEQLYLSSTLECNADAMIRLCGIYLDSKDASIRAKAFPLAAKACALGEPAGIFLLADCILSGNGVEQNIDIAFSIIDKAYQDYFECLSGDDERDLKGFANFAYRLGKYYQYGIGVDKYPEFAIKLYLFSKLACKNCSDLGYTVPLILGDVEKEINQIAKEQSLFESEPIFDANMFFDTFSFVQEDEMKKHIHVVSYDEEHGTLEFEITFDKPVALIDSETLSCLMKSGTVRWQFSNIAYFHGGSGDYNRVGSNDGESWVFYNGDAEVMTIRYKNGKTEGHD